jgi:hypothetical protein
LFEICLVVWLAWLVSVLLWSLLAEVADQQILQPVAEEELLILKEAEKEEPKEEPMLVLL